MDLAHTSLLTSAATSTRSLDNISTIHYITYLLDGLF